MSAGPGGALGVHGALRIRGALPRGPAGDEMSGQVSPAACAALAGGTKSCLIDAIAAAKPEKLANRCPLCHENFSPGEEVRAGRRGGSGELVRDRAVIRAQGAFRELPGLFPCHWNGYCAYLCAQVISSLSTVDPRGAGSPGLWGG